MNHAAWIRIGSSFWIVYLSRLVMKWSYLFYSLTKRSCTVLIFHAWNVRAKTAFSLFLQSVENIFHPCWQRVRKLLIVTLWLWHKIFTINIFLVICGKFPAYRLLHNVHNIFFFFSKRIRTSCGGHCVLQFWVFGQNKFLFDQMWLSSHSVYTTQLHLNHSDGCFKADFLLEGGFGTTPACDWVEYIFYIMSENSHWCKKKHVNFVNSFAFLFCDQIAAQNISHRRISEKSDGFILHRPVTQFFEQKVFVV